MLKRQQSQNFLQGAMILSTATALVKIIGAIFKIPLQNLLGGAGTAYFDAAYQIYAVLFVASTAGLPVAISKMVSEAEARGRYNEGYRTFRVAFGAFFIIGTIGTALMVLFSQQLANFMNQPEANYAIMAIAPAMFFVSIISSYRGFNHGKQNMFPTAYSQVCEAFGKLVIGLALAYWVLRTTGNLMYAAAGAIAGTAVGTVFSALYMVLASRGLKPTAPDTIPLRPRKMILADILKIAVPVMISASVLSFTNLIDVAQINGLLVSAAGFTRGEAAFLRGSYVFAQSMFNLPGAFILTIGISVLPVIAAAMARGDKKNAGETITTSLKMAMLLALPASAGMMALANPIVKMLYPNAQAEAEIAGPLLVMLCWAIPFVCLTTITTSILQSLGRVKTPILIMALGGAVKIILNNILVSNPDIHISGAPVGTLACYLLISLVNIAVIIVIVRPPKLITSFIKPVIAAVLMGFAAWGIQVTLSPIMGNTISTAIAILCGVILYIVLVLVLRILSYNDALLLPKGEKLARFIKK